MSLSAADFWAHKPAIEHLCTVNSQWHKYSTLSPQKQIAFSSDKERIQYHLRQVTAVLKGRSTLGLHPKQRERRTALLDSLERYAEKAAFPGNTEYPERGPCFIDPSGVYCAVAHLIKASDHQALALQIQKTQNYAYLLNMPSKKLQKWAQKHGFTLEELAWIQPTYDKRELIARMPELGKVSGKITKALPFVLKGEKGGIALGTFDTVWNADSSYQISNGLAFYSAGKWQCVGHALSGRAYHILFPTTENVLLVAGQFAPRGRNCSVALLNGDGSWEFPLAQKQSVWETHHISEANIDGQLYYSCFRPEMGKTVVGTLHGRGRADIVTIVAGKVYDLQTVATVPGTTRGHHLILSGDFDSLSFAVYSMGKRVSWVRSAHLLVAEIETPIKVALKEHPELYLVDTAHEYHTYPCGTSQTAPIYQSLAHEGYLYSLGPCGTDSTDVRYCISKRALLRPEEVLDSIEVVAHTETPVLISAGLFFTGKRLIQNPQSRK